MGPQDDAEHFFLRPVKAAYWALHMVGITDKWKPYKKQERRDNIQDLEQALECVKAKQPNFQYMEIKTEDYGKPGRLFANLDRTPQPDLPKNLDVNKLWIIFRILYGKYTTKAGKRTGFKKTDSALGYALYHNAVIIGGTNHMYHVSKKWLAQTITAQTHEDPTVKAHARRLFERTQLRTPYRNRQRLLHLPQPRSRQS